MATQMIIRIEQELKDKASRLARAEGTNMSELVRRLIENYVKERDIGSYIDRIWDDTGSKLKERGISQSDVSRVIRQIRSEK